jgi:hypothetical protein
MGRKGAYSGWCRLGSVRGDALRCDGDNRRQLSFIFPKPGSTKTRRLFPPYHHSVPQHTVMDATGSAMLFSMYPFLLLNDSTFNGGEVHANIAHSTATDDVDVAADRCTPTAASRYRNLHVQAMQYVA